ncbi:thiamine ABC transporter substrate-binding protein [Leucobacter denitrificans]|uniref:Thiamine ABC transporter substrate-binding protein n=1 Tax=Leucobacter denitrificans TaxID=683042 RepID=A0A7G9S6K3_9MICO|nr:thiamine ABC transporter substrate-binding protein [Leucobacter denitrificans]QNN63478.1 thiamine ABC transporter substrate-binding protein [Leucobacter denitrificans]
MTYVRNRSTARLVAISALPLAAALALTSCSNGGADEAETGTESSAVTLVVHDSFIDGEAFSAAAKEATGYDVEVMTAGDGGELTNKLVLTQGAPIADAFFGVDNTFASRIIDGGVAAPVDASILPAGALELAHAVNPDGTEEDSVPLVPIDMGATCINIDTAWFAEQGIAEPESFEDLTEEQYRDLTVLLDPTASSTGASFMIATVAAFGEEGFADYWKQLDENGARIVQGWSDAYYGEFTGASDTGTRPIVLSYSSSPAFTVNEDGTASTTRALLDTCSTQVEYAGVLEGAANPEGAQAVIEYLLSSEFQQSIPDEMYMYPVDESAELPAAWAEFAPLPAEGQTHDLSSSEVQAGLQDWLRTLGDTVGL